MRGWAVALCSVSLVAVPTLVGATPGQGPNELRPERLKVPGAYLRMRDHVSTDASRALALIVRTENHRDSRYASARRVVSDRVAAQLQIDADALDAAWSGTTRAHQIAILAALTQLDVSYTEGAEIPYVAMDCSGLLWYAWRAAGVDMPREAVSQLDRKFVIPREKARAGDIVGEGDHVHIYLGVGRAMVHAPNTGGDVTLKMMGDEQWNKVTWADPTRIAIFRVS